MTLNASSSPGSGRLPRSGVTCLRPGPRSSPGRRASACRPRTGPNHCRYRCRPGIAVEPLEVLERVKARRLDRSGAVRAHRGHRGMGRRGHSATSVDHGASRGRHRVRHRRRHDPALQLRHAAREGPAPGLAAVDADADAEQPRRRTSGWPFGAKAGVHTPVSACASGNEAIAHGIDMIRLGRADVMIVGGTEAAIHPLPLAAFAQMMALSQPPGRPAARRRVPGTSTATASCSARAPASWSSRAPIMPRPGARRCTPRLPARVSPQTRMTSPSPTPRALARPARSRRRSRECGLATSRHRPYQRPRHLDPQGDVAECCDHERPRR